MRTEHRGTLQGANIIFTKIYPHFDVFPIKHEAEEIVYTTSLVEIQYVQNNYSPWMERNIFMLAASFLKRDFPKPFFEER